MTTQNFKLNLILSAMVIALTACNSDSTGTSSTMQNTPPVITGLPDTAVKTGTDYTFTPYASDVDGDALTYEIANKPDWATFDPATGMLSGMPENQNTGDYNNIIISVKDGQNKMELTPFSIHVLAKDISRDQIQIEGNLLDVLPQNQDAVSAMEVTGTTTFRVGNHEQTLADSSLQMEFDANGNLVHMAGETKLPAKMANDLALSSTTKAKVGMYKGSDINADPDLGITLKDDIYYFVYYIGSNTDITIGSENATHITLEPPMSGELIFISDPTDPFYYYFANIPFVGEGGFGRSQNGFIPFVPEENFTQLDAFDGHTIEKGSFSLGIKAVDLLSFEGTRVTKMPEAGEIDWDHAMDSSLSYKTGINGKAEFALSVFSVGLFSFDLASASATLDMSLNRQHFALQGTIAPDVSWQPDWFAILPEGKMVNTLVVDGNSGFAATISGTFKSSIPEAAFAGEMKLTQNGATFSAHIPDKTLPLDISATFANDETSVEIKAPVDISSTITQSVNDQLDTQLANIEQAVNHLTDSISAYEFEVSLRGVRQAIPAIVDQTTPILNDLPDNVYNSVYSAVKKGIEDTCYSGKILGVSYHKCARDYVDAAAEARSAASTAKTKTQTEVDNIIPALQELKQQALAADDVNLRAALKTALLKVYGYRTISINVTKDITIDLPSPIPNQTYTVNRTETRTILDTATANKLKTAADNVYRIQETSDIMFSAQTVVDHLPTREVISQVKQDVNSGLAKIPSFQGAGYTVSQGNYVSYIILNNEKVAVNANVLNPIEMLNAITTEINRRLQAGNY